VSERESDLRMLKELLDEHLEELTEWEVEAFADMRCSLTMYPGDVRERNGFHQLTEKQREAVKRAHERLVPQYENLVSSGKVPRGREVELMVRDKPLRPPRKVVPE
jgi:hypothetical protein